MSSSKSEEQNKLDSPDKGKTLDAKDVVQGTAEDKVVGVGRGTRRSPRHRRLGYVRRLGTFSSNIYFKLSSSKLEEQNKLDLPDEGKTLDATDVVQGTAKDKVVGVGQGTRQSPRHRRLGYVRRLDTFSSNIQGPIKQGAMVMMIAAGQGAMPWIGLPK